MSIKVTTQLMTICDKFGLPLKGVRKCASEFEVAEKLSKLPPGEYSIYRPHIKVVIK